MTKIFISYRLEDSQEEITRVSSHLNKHSQQNSNGQLLTRAADLPEGTDFHQRLSGTIKNSEVVLVIIGKNWLAAKNGDGIARLQDPLDAVRTEIESAFVFGVPVIPVLIEGGMLPLASQLPHSLHNLTTTMPSSVRPDTDFEGDIEHLVGRINNHLSVPIDVQETVDAGQNKSIVQRLLAGISRKASRKASTEPLTNSLTAALANQRANSLKKLKTKRTVIVSCLATATMMAAGMLTFQIYARYVNSENNSIKTIKSPTEIAFVAKTQNGPEILSEISGTVKIDNNTLELSTDYGVIESNLKTRGFVQNVRFGLAKKFYAFDRFRVVSWSEPHNIEQWIDTNSALSLTQLSSTISVPPPEFESPSSKDKEKPLKGYWLVVQVRLRDDAESDSSTIYAHSDKDIFSTI